MYTKIMGKKKADVRPTELGRCCAPNARRKAGVSGSLVSVSVLSIADFQNLSEG